MRVFWRRKRLPDTAAAPVSYPEYDALGFEHDDPALHGKDNVAFGIRSDTRIHMSIFGIVGSGKSSIMKLLILQNLQRGDGFMLVDPHGELARTVLSIIPKSRHDDIIYINPSSIYKYGRTVLINPLEVRSEEERYVVVMSFVNALFNLYKDSWGPRLETVLRNAANALVETKNNNTLGDITRMISSQADRKVLLRMVTSENVRHFWTEIFEKQYSKDAGSSAYNKMDKIMSTPAVAAMLDSTKSSIQISDIIRNKRMLIVDLSSGASDDVAAFIGTILLNMLYVEAKKRMSRDDDIEDIRKNPFYVYVDEAHLFGNSTMSEMLRALRKFGVKMTIATQTINAYEKSFADEICGVCQTIVCGKCDYNTAKVVQSSMPISIEELQNLQNHTFAFCSAEGGVPVHGVCKSQPIPAPDQHTYDWRKVARHSLQRWGEVVSIKRYMRQSIVRDIPLSPLDAAILHMLHYSNRDMTRQEITENVNAVFGKIKTVDVAGALINRLERDLRFVESHLVKTGDGDGNLSSRYSVTAKARETYFSHAAYGRRAGSDLHLETMFQIADLQMRRGNYSRCDLGDSRQSLPDVLILEPEMYEESDGRHKKSTERWNERTALAIEVETDPTKHIEQIYRNWKKNADDNLNVWFIVFNERHRDAIFNKLEEKGIRSSEYHVTIIPKEMVMSRDLLNVDVPILSETFKSTLPECGPRGRTVKPHIDERHDSRVGYEGGIKDKDGAPQGSECRENVTANLQEGSKGSIGGATRQHKEMTSGDGGSCAAADTAAGRGHGTAEIPHLTLLEWEIYSIVNEGMSASPTKIRTRMRSNVPVGDIRSAVASLVKKGLVVSEYQTVQKRVDSLRDGSPKRVNRRERIIRKAALVPNAESVAGRSRMVPSRDTDETTKSRKAEYTMQDFEGMGRGRLVGLLHSDRTTDKQKKEIRDIMKSRGYSQEP